MANSEAMPPSILLVLFIIFICAGVGYVIFCPFVYTVTKCRGTKRFVGLTYSLLNFIIGSVLSLIFNPLANAIEAVGGDMAKDLASALHVTWAVIWCYISFVTVMGKMKKALTEPKRTE
jgi:predicted PurR-regulated permease PerM